MEVCLVLGVRYACPRVLVQTFPAQVLQSQSCWKTHYQNLPLILKELVKKYDVYVSFTQLDYILILK